MIIPIHESSTGGGIALTGRGGVADFIGVGLTGTGSACATCCGAVTSLAGGEVEGVVSVERDAAGGVGDFCTAGSTGDVF